jgi:hypothetical protein
MIDESYWQCLAHVDYMRHLREEGLEPTFDDEIWEQISKDFVELYNEKRGR